MLVNYKLVGFTTDREFTYALCGISVTLPRRFLFGCQNYTRPGHKLHVQKIAICDHGYSMPQLCFDDAIDRADTDALG